MPINKYIGLFFSCKFVVAPPPQARGDDIILQQARRVHKQKGFSLVEAMVATALMTVGFVGVFSLAALSGQVSGTSAARQKLQIQANQIYEIIDSDVANIDSYDNMDMTSCAVPGGSETNRYVLRGYEWCSRIAGEFGSATGSEIRSVNVTNLAGGGKTVHVHLEARNGTAQVTMKRVYND